VTASFYLAWALPTDQSIPVWERVLALYEAQLARQPEAVQVKRNVALTSKYLADALDNVDRRPEALTHHRRAMELDQSRLEAAPNDRQAQLDAAISYTALAIAVEHLDQDVAQAAELVERSIVLRRRVVEADPKDVQARERLVYGLTLLAQYQRRRGELAVTRSLLLEAIDIQNAVLQRTGDNSGRRQLGFAWYLMGLLEDETAHPSASCAAMQHAERHFSEAAEYLSSIQQDQLGEVRDRLAKCR
jgi:tetratricopeptide (TPR) repeat protein